VEILAVIGIVLLLLYLVTPLIVFSLSSRVSRLESDLRELRRQTDDLHSATFHTERLPKAQPTMTPEAQTTTDPIPVSPLPSKHRDITEVLETIYAKRVADAAASIAAAEIVTPPPLPLQPGQTEPEPSIFREQSAAAVEWLAERWMAWIGAAALLLGLGFFLKYAMDRGWIGPEVRVAMGLAFGAALYGLGAYLLRKDY
jgi:uncharacterized membrane protein